MNSFYVTGSFQQSVLYIKVNTDWTRTGYNVFTNGEEKITILTSPDSLRGQRPVGKIYYDYTFSKLGYRISKEWDEMFYYIGVDLTELEERT